MLSSSTCPSTNGDRALAAAVWVNVWHGDTHPARRTGMNTP